MMGGVMIDRHRCVPVVRSVTQARKVNGIELIKIEIKG